LHNLESNIKLNEAFDILVNGRTDKENFYSMVGVVNAVNETKRTCDVTPIDGQAKRSGMRLQAILSSAVGFVLIPKVNSKVVITFFDRQTGFVSLCEEVDKILIDTALVQFNLGANDGLVNINDLVTSMNVIEAKLDTFIVIFNAHVHSGVTTGAGVSAISTTLETVHGQTSVKGDWEDASVLH